MNNLIEFLKKYNYWLFFIVLEIISLVLMFRYNSYQGSVWFTQANEFSAKVNGVYQDIDAFINLSNVNQRLTARNTELELETARLREKLREATRDTSRTEQWVLDSLKQYHLYPAKVVSASIVKNDNYLVIDKGTADGIKPEMGVVGGGGVVGIVCMVNVHHSLVLPVINLKSSISCRIRRTSYYGFLKWYGGSTYYANLVDVPQYAKPKVGDIIETSGFSGVFPPGIFVGKISKVVNSGDGNTMRLDVNLGTDFANIRDVNVIENISKPELDSIFVKMSAVDEKME